MTWHQTRINANGAAELVDEMTVEARTEVLAELEAERLFAAEAFEQMRGQTALDTDSSES